jgi:hypothetical protein
MLIKNNFICLFVSDGIEKSAKNAERIELTTIAYKRSPSTMKAHTILEMNLENLINDFDTMDFNNEIMDIFSDTAFMDDFDAEDVIMFFLF